MVDVKLILVDPNDAVCDAWKLVFEQSPDISIVRGRFEALPEFDCMVGAANSFGLMDGGVDLAITRFFGLQLMERVQAHILDEYLGEQPVGTSFIIETRHPRHPFLAHTPTGRVRAQEQGRLRHEPQGDTASDTENDERGDHSTGPDPAIIVKGSADDWSKAVDCVRLRRVRRVRRIPPAAERRRDDYRHRALRLGSTRRRRGRARDVPLRAVRG
jgi:hypothetical protein